jgi:PPP family 3-phenylpropionic acid transporter
VIIDASNLHRAGSRAIELIRLRSSFNAMYMVLCCSLGTQLLAAMDDGVELRDEPTSQLKDPPVDDDGDTHFAVAEDLSARHPLCPFNRLQLIKLAYLVLFTGLPLMGAFGSLVYESQGFEASTIGWLLAVPPLGTILVTPPVATFAETHHAHLKVMMTGAALAATFVLLINWATVVPIVVASAVLFGLASRPMSILLDEYSMAVIGSRRKAEWGTYRVYGAYGWAVSSVVTSYVGGTFGWRWAAFIYVSGVAGAMLCVYEAPATHRGAPGAHHFGDVLRRFANQPRVVGYFAACTVMGAGSTLISGYLFLYLKTLGAQSVLFGLCIVFTVTVEVPLFRNSAWLYGKFGDQQLILGAMTAWVVRVIGYSVLQNPWFVLVLEPLHGLTFGLTWLAAMRFFPAAFPKEFSSSAISLAHAAANGLGPIVGNIVGGYAYDHFGPRVMFRGAAVIMAVAAMLFYCFDRWVQSAPRDAVAVASGDASVDVERGPTPPPVSLPAANVEIPLANPAAPALEAARLAGALEIAENGEFAYSL